MIVVICWVERLREQATFGPVVEARVPDHALEDIVLTSLDQSGVPKYRIEAPLMAHFDDDDSTEFESPVMLIFRRSAPPLNVQSERAWVSSNKKEIFLIGNVTIVIQETEAQSTYTIKTRDLRVFTQHETATTRQSILAFNAQHRIQGVGATINLINARVKIFHQARGLYEP